MKTWHWDDELNMAINELRKVSTIGSHGQLPSTETKSRDTAYF
jgi:hypothetical protein